ncbi:MAG: bifunctional folylpolyglutamate synthase/dihydrofolate synthase [Phycisphaeraceae bacterium]|nr:bifunctional folylpolyglutamate synthase/dihydrofolate synthase [Phycisphaeraceae bacterium]
MPTSTSKSKKTTSGRSLARAPRSRPSRANTDITNYSSATRWLLQHVNHERMRVVPYNTKAFSLDRMNKFLKLVGNPHNELKCVQIAGTKGKGSTCAMLSSMLQACGYTVGLYTSPHLVDVRERITVNGEMISHADLTESFKSLQKLEKKLGEDMPTYFEVLTATALCYFADQAVDIVILETGLGGRLDSTDVVTPLVCGLVHIGLDHTNILGKRIVDIAREKAGIFKKNIPVISVEQTEEVCEVFDEVAEKVNSPLEYTGNQIDFSHRFEANRELGPHTRVSLTTKTSKFEHLPVPLKGEHQSHNCALALALLDKLKGHDFSFDQDKIVEGLAQTVLAGRMEQVFKEPRVLIDGAHNADSIYALIRALGAHISYDSLVMIFGCGQDKDITGMLTQLSLGADKVIFTRSKLNPRACEPADLLSQFTEITGKMAQTADNLEDALRLASHAVSREDLIVVTGSFYLAGETKKFFIDLPNRKPAPTPHRGLRRR